MKTTLLALLMLFGLSVQAETEVEAQACPDLSGVYTCGEEELTVETFELNGVYYLEFNGNGGLPADGAWLQLPDSEEEKNAKFRLTCGDKAPYGSHFLLDYESDLYQQGQYVAFLDAEVYFYINVNNELAQDTVGVAKGSWGEQPIDEKIVCTKKSVSPDNNETN
ncbi:MAG: hypothetical protein KDD58_11270 [Bdellovibrionales bacterium]|nr:hypothetical protein [Bdellovibrionales bacterium]